MRDAMTPPRPFANIPARIAAAALLVTMASGLGGCAGGGAGNGAFAMAAAGPGATISFESIDGPPPQIFDRMVNVLDSESKLRSLSIVSREAPANYRVRSYLSGQSRPRCDRVGLGRL